MAPVVVVGASLAGMNAVEAMRAGGYEGDVVVLEASDTLPADRPPLSKQVLSGEWDLQRAAQPAHRRLGELDVDVRLGSPAATLHAGARRVGLARGGHLEASGIVIATGAHARHLPGPPMAGVHVLRTGEDCLSLRADLDRGPSRVVVVGAGFIGAEVAATCRGRGLEVTIIEAAPVPLARALPPEIGSFVADLHRSHGVEVRLGVGIDSLLGDGLGVRGVGMADGTQLDAAVVVVGIGVEPAVGWLEGSGLEVLSPARGGGVLCDATLLAAPGIVAAGDVAAWPNPAFGAEPMRVEHWENAVEQGTHAGRRLLAELDGPAARREVPPFSSLPWFWSDQYDVKIQMVGRGAPGDEVVVVDGDPADGRFVALLRRGGVCSAAIGVGRPRHVMQARMQMVRSTNWDDVAGIFG